MVEKLGMMMVEKLDELMAWNLAVRTVVMLVDMMVV